MTLDEIDRAIAAWDERLAQADQNLLDLNDGDYALVEQTAPRFIGVTREQVLPAITAMRALFAQRQQVDDVMTRIKAKRSALPRIWPARQRLDEIAELLRGPSVALGTTMTPVEQRRLFTPGSAAERATLDDVMQTMAGEFDAVRTAVVAVTESWQRVNPALDALQQKLAALDQFARGVGLADDSELTSLHAEAEALRTRVATDPLGARADFDLAIQPRLREVNERLEGLAKARADVQQQLRDARARLAALQQAHGTAIASLARFHIEIAAEATPRADDAELADLAAWLTRIDQAAAAGRAQAAEIGLRRFADAVEQAIAGDQRATAADQAALDLRDELRGRLAARQAQLRQLRQLRRQGIVADSDLDGQGAALARLLAQTPTPLQAAVDQFAAFEARLRALTAPDTRHPAPDP
jgi:hypothetical protein